MDVGRADINNVLAQMRQLKAQAQVQPVNPGLDIKSGLGTDAVSGIKQGPEFSTMFKSAINSVNETQQTAKVMVTAYEQGDPGVSLSQVMVASQKASVSFEALTQVRNKLVEAYQSVMNMPI